MTTEVKQQPTDTERLEWCLRYGHVKTLGTYRDFDYLPLTLEIIDKGIEREKAKVVGKAETEGE